MLPPLVPFDATSNYLYPAINLYARTWGRNYNDSVKFIRDFALKQRDYYGLVGLEDDKVIAMGFGTRSQPGQWWHDKVAEKVGKNHPALQNAWVVTELAVDEGHRNRGLGTHMLDCLLTSQPCPRALLSTRADNAGARRLYERLGWRYLHDGFPFWRGDPMFVIMHLEMTDWQRQ